ncbi:hypothetical protein T484DRAFT_1801034 [Baffinella frigidus]|nr:hypothetical protein T484DRAFT_1801034 [Cryptophyta sp. CCMP2293]
MSSIDLDNAKQSELDTDPAFPTDLYDVTFGAPGFVLHYLLLLLLFILNYTENLQQYGFYGSKFGRGIKFLTFAFCSWIQISLVITILSNYNHVWVYSYLSPGQRGTPSTLHPPP